MSSIYSRISRCGFSARLFAFGLLAASFLVSTPSAYAAYYNVTGAITGIDTVGATSDPGLTMVPGNPPFGDAANANPLAVGNHASVWKIDTAKKTVTGILDYPSWKTDVAVNAPVVGWMYATITQPNAIYRFGAGTVAYDAATRALTLGQAITFGGNKDQGSDARLLWNSSPAVPTAAGGSCTGNSTVCGGQNQYFLANPDQERFYMKLTFSADGKSFTGEGVGIDVGGSLSIGVTGNTFQSYTFSGTLIILDQDGDKVDDETKDKCLGTAAGAKVDASGCAAEQRDTDKDTVNDALDKCPSTPAGAVVDAKGCATSQLDGDNDGVKDDIDQCPNTLPQDADTVDAVGCVIATSPVDTDKDGVVDATDNCPTVVNADQINTDGAPDGGDACDLDDDNDGVADTADQCPLVAGSIANNGCLVVVADADSDGVPDSRDNCKLTPNPDQKNADRDALGDVCDATPRGEDPDGDNIPDLDDKCPNTATGAVVDANGCSQVQIDAKTDTDGDGVLDNVDNCKTASNANQKNKDGDALGDACDDDIDGDGKLNAADNCPLVVNADQKDSDGDGTGDLCQNSVALDASFDVDGKTSTAGATGYSYANAVVQLVDGTSVAAGLSNVGDAANVDEAITLVKFKADGTLDTAFGSGGSVVSNLTLAANDAALAIVEQSDHKLVMAGFANGAPTSLGGEKVLLARFDANGAPDTTFGTAGVYAFSAGAGYEKLQSLVQQPDGKLVAAGYVCVDASCAQSQALLLRLDASGRLDPTFGVNGLKRLNYGVATSSNNIGLALQADGKLVTVGAMCVDAACARTDSVVARFNADGALDTSFASTGYAAISTLGLASQLNAVKVSADGKIVATGSSILAANSGEVIVVKLNSDGSFDTAFGRSGIVHADITTSADDADTGTSITLQSDGAILVGGVAGAVGAEDMFLARYSATGKLDGTTLLDFTTDENDGAYALSEVQGGKVLLVGSTQTATKVDTLAVARFNAPFAAVSTDDDDDNVPNDVDLCPGTAAGAAVDAKGCSFAQRPNDDDDKDLVLNAQDICPNTAAGALGVDVNGCSSAQRPTDDDDKDSVINSADVCPNTLLGALGVDANGCSSAQRPTDDDDQDNVINSADTCPNTLLGAAGVNESGCSTAQRPNDDDDKDSVINSADTCPNTLPDATGVNASGCSTAQRPNDDDDQDGVTNINDYCPGTSVGTPVTSRGCEDTVVLPPQGKDTDGDGKPDSRDNCPLVANKDQLNTDKQLGNNEDALGDACDDDDDGDGVPDYIDAEPLNPDVTSERTLMLDGKYQGAVVSEKQGYR